MELMSVEEKEYEIACEQVLHCKFIFFTLQFLDLSKIMSTIFFFFCNFLNQRNSERKSSFYGILYLLFKDYNYWYCFVVVVVVVLFFCFFSFFHGALANANYVMKKLN